MCFEITSGTRSLLNTCHHINVIIVFQPYQDLPSKFERRFFPNTGFLFTNGIMRWRKVRKIYVPQQWYTLIKKKDRSKYDFAVLELRREHRRPYMTPNTFHRSHGSKIRFNGFKNNKNANTMWTTRCFVHHNWNGYLINRCDVAKGMSGSGSYLFLNRKNYIVRGLVVAAVSFRKGQDVYRFNVVNPLTREKTKQICRWMKAGSDCKSFM